jgi:hypothetical protein
MLDVTRNTAEGEARLAAQPRQASRRTSDISEAASKKLQLGRPRTLPLWWEKRLYPDIKTDRGQHNHYFATEAMIARTHVGRRQS